MEIKAKCKYDFKACKAMAHAYSYKKKKPLKTVLIHIALAFALAFLNFIVIKLTGADTVNMVAFVLCLLIVVLELLMYFLMPQLQYNSMSKMKDMSNDYIFRDNDFVATAESEEYKGDSVIKYTLLEKVMETGEYFLLFENKRQVFLVDKTTVEGGTAEEIRQKLQSVLGKKYIICKY